jgi:hypothetical protein
LPIIARDFAQSVNGGKIIEKKVRKNLFVSTKCITFAAVNNQTTKQL